MTDIKKNHLDINYLEENLNDLQFVNGIWYRPNHSLYDFVCMINNIIALRKSGNYEYIPGFVRRINKYLNSERQKYLSNDYMSLVINYIKLITLELDKIKLHHKGKLINASELIDL